MTLNLALQHIVMVTFLYSLPFSVVYFVGGWLVGDSFDLITEHGAGGRIPVEEDGISRQDYIIMINLNANLSHIFHAELGKGIMEERGLVFLVRKGRILRPGKICLADPT